MSFCDELTREQQAPHLKAFEALGAWVERANDQFVCLNVPPEADYDALLGHLDFKETDGSLEYETCEERVPGSFDDRPGDDDEEEGGA